MPATVLLLPPRLLVVALLFVAAAPAAAQEMEPKAYSASPVSATFLVASLSRSTGSVVFDPTLPIKDVEAGINGLAIGVGTTFGLFGKLALISAIVPGAWGDITGQVFEEARTISRAGLADTRVRLSVNLRGNDAMRLARVRQGATPHHRRGQRAGVGAERRVRPDQADQPREPPMGVQAGGRRRRSSRAVGHRRVSRPVALHRKRRLLSGRPGALPGSSCDPAKPRELHVQAPAVAGGGRDLVFGRRAPWWRAASRPAG